MRESDGEGTSLSAHQFHIWLAGVAATSACRHGRAHRLGQARSQLQKTDMAGALVVAGRIVRGHRLSGTGGRLGARVEGFP